MTDLALEYFHYENNEKKSVKGALATKNIKNQRYDLFCSITNDSEIVK